MVRIHLKQFAAIAILLATVILFTRFFMQHPAYWQQLRQVSPWTILWVILLNVLMLAALVGICTATVSLSGRHIGLRDNFLLTSYSSIINFFGPLQSGPSVRGIYLKARYGVRLRDYTLATLLYLGLFAAFSAFFLLVGTRPWWQTLIALCLVAGFSKFVYQQFKKRDKQANESHFALRAEPLALLALLAFGQVLITIAWYFIELRAVNQHVSLHQAMSYAGAANFALFVSITPDAIGIREAFLAFTQHIHHVSTANIISANLIDRAAYVIFLAMLFVVVLLTHAKARLRVKTAAATEE
ncbi:MAG TPA: lysylphosphatidylglycerol synthase domain-containing protein [Candidatus Saccharimonadales bacterium]|nr:lysylphosphatidylglycerol synthase domain-containing protein [Candidatus Saccharimonadales bacterium]